MLSPAQRGHGLRFHARSYQRRYLGAYARREFRRYYRVWPRRAGKDDSGLCGRIQRIVRLEQQGRIGNYWIGFPELEQGKKALWDNICGHGMRMVEHVPPAARAGRNWLLESEYQVHFRGGSILQLIGCRFPNKIRGPNPIEIEFSEWAQTNPGAWDVVRPILIANGGAACFNTTPFGRNHGHKLWEKVCDDPTWYTERLVVDGLRRDSPGEDGRSILSPEWPAPERSVEQAIAQMLAEGVDPDFIEQEYRCSWAGSMTGAYYGALVERARNEGRVGYVPHAADLPVHTVWDRGDTNAIWFVQVVGRRWHAIDYLETNGLALPEIMDLLRLGHRAAYRFGCWMAGHDMFESRDYFSTGVTSYELARSLYGIEFTMAPRVSVQDGIEAGRALLKRVWFDDARTVKGLDALQSYHRKWLDDRKAFSDAPVHDWSSHGADAWRYAGVAARIIEQWQSQHGADGKRLAAPNAPLPGLPAWATSDNSWMGV